MVKQREDREISRRVKKARNSHLPTPKASSLRSVDSDRTGYQEFSNFKGRYTGLPLRIRQGRRKERDESRDDEEETQHVAVG